jgi:hypothetical protein
MKTFMKRILNTVVTAPIFLFIIYFIGETILSNIFWFLEFERPSFQNLNAVGALSLGVTFFVLLVLGIIFCGFCILEILITGNGLLWKRIEEEDFEHPINRKIFNVRNTNKFIWRLDPVFKGRRPIYPFV